MSTIGINNLSYNYGSFTALKNITLQMDVPELICLVGPNGSGKSTLLKCLTGLLKVPKNIISINGKDINSYKSSLIAENISYVPQITELVSGFTVREITEMGRHPYKDTSRNKEKVDYALELTKTEGIMNKDCSELSGGEFQRVMIGRAIAQDTPIMILDEPVSHLDIKYQIEVMETLQRLSSEKKILIITSIHDLNLAILYSWKVILLNEGKLFAYGTPENVLDKEVINKVYQTNISSIRVNDKSSLIFPKVGS